MAAPAVSGFSKGRPSIGVSLPYDYLCGANRSPAARLFAAALGPVEEGLRKLGKEHVECIELGVFSADAPERQIIDAVANVWSAQLQASLHPSLVPVRDAASLEALYPWLGTLLEKRPSFQERILLTVHSFSGGRGDPAEYRGQTVRVLQWMADSATRQNLPIQFALELNRAKGKVDPSTTYHGVLDMCGEIGDSRVGICWDWGHAQANAVNGVCPLDPPLEFLRRVIHTHIHDLGPDGGTHWPLTRGEVPVSRRIDALKSLAYSGCYLLELNPVKFSDRLDVGESISGSVIRLREELGGG
jgi:hypothetical protein